MFCNEKKRTKQPTTIFIATKRNEGTNEHLFTKRDNETTNKNATKPKERDNEEQTFLQRSETNETANTTFLQRSETNETTNKTNVFRYFVLFTSLHIFVVRCFVGQNTGTGTA